MLLFAAFADATGHTLTSAAAIAAWNRRSFPSPPEPTPEAAGAVETGEFGVDVADDHLIPSDPTRDELDLTAALQFVRERRLAKARGLHWCVPCGAEHTVAPEMMCPCSCGKAEPPTPTETK